MKNLVLTLILVFVYVNTFSQKVYSDNRDSSITHHFKKTKIDPLVIENTAWGFVSVSFNITKDGGIKNIEKQFANDNLLYPGIISALQQSSGQWILAKNHKKKTFQVTFLIEPFFADEIKVSAERNIYENFKRLRNFNSGTAYYKFAESRAVIMLPVIKLGYELINHKALITQ